MIYGFGSFMGSGLAAYVTEYYTPYHLFVFSAFMSMMVTISGMCVHDDIETNEYASMKDPIEIQEENQQNL